MNNPVDINNNSSNQDRTANSNQLSVKDNFESSDISGTKNNQLENKIEESVKEKKFEEFPEAVGQSSQGQSIIEKPVEEKQTEISQEPVVALTVKPSESGAGKFSAVSLNEAQSEIKKLIKISESGRNFYSITNKYNELRTKEIK